MSNKAQQIGCDACSQKYQIMKEKSRLYKPLCDDWLSEKILGQVFSKINFNFSGLVRFVQNALEMSKSRRVNVNCKN